MSRECGCTLARSVLGNLVGEMDIRLFCGSANPDLCDAVAGRLRIPTGRRVLERFPDGEIHLQIEETVRGRDVYLLQSTSPPIHEHLMELLVMIDACRRSAAGRITAIIPYYGYSRQEKISVGREPITARLVADLLTVTGADRVVSVDLHAAAIQGFFTIEVDHLMAMEILVDYLRNRVQPDSVVVSPDAGRVKIVQRYATSLQVPLVILHKERRKSGEPRVTAVIGEVRDRRPIVVDDMITTGGTISEAVLALLGAGAQPDIVVAATHGLLVGKALERLNHPAISEVVITDTVSQPAGGLPPRYRVLSVADLLAETVRRLNEDRSISALYPPW